MPKEKSTKKGANPKETKSTNKDIRSFAKDVKSTKSEDTTPDLIEMPVYSYVLIAIMSGKYGADAPIILGIYSTYPQARDQWAPWKESTECSCDGEIQRVEMNKDADERSSDTVTADEWSDFPVKNPFK